MTVQVPSSFIVAVQYASVQTRIPYQVMAAQAWVESGFQLNAVSSAGAEGWLQFLPSTFAAYGKGSPFNMWDATYAYVNFMNELLREFGQNVRNALAAYNAGPLNYRAGLGYADEIIALAGSPNIKQVPTSHVAPTYAPAPAATSTDDDWSDKIRQTGGWFSTLGIRLHNTGSALERMLHHGENRRRRVACCPAGTEAHNTAVRWRYRVYGRVGGHVPYRFGTRAGHRGDGAHSRITVQRRYGEGHD